MQKESGVQVVAGRGQGRDALLTTETPGQQHGQMMVKQKEKKDSGCGCNYGYNK